MSRAGTTINSGTTDARISGLSGIDGPMGAVRRAPRRFLAGLDAERGALGIGMVATGQLRDRVRQRLGLFDGRPAVFAPRRQLRRNRG